MSRYIDAELIKYQKNYKRGLGIDHDINEHGYYYTANKNDIDKVPTADVEPVVHAHWRMKFKLQRDDLYECSRCTRLLTLPKGTSPILLQTLYPYCNCGAKMDEENKVNEN